MNPLTNRWAALAMVAFVLLAVAELVGTDDQGGVLARAAGSPSADGAEQVMGAAPPGVVEVIEGEETPEADLPQVIHEDSPEIVDPEQVMDGSIDDEEIAEVMGSEEFVEYTEDE